MWVVNKLQSGMFWELSIVKDNYELGLQSFGCNNPLKKVIIYNEKDAPEEQPFMREYADAMCKSLNQIDRDYEKEMRASPFAALSIEELLLMLEHRSKKARGKRLDHHLGLDYVLACKHEYYELEEVLKELQLRIFKPPK